MVDKTKHEINDDLFEAAVTGLLVDCSKEKCDSPDEMFNKVQELTPSHAKEFIDKLRDTVDDDVEFCNSVSRYAQCMGPIIHAARATSKTEDIFMQWTVVLITRALIGIVGDKGNMDALMELNHLGAMSE